MRSLGVRALLVLVSLLGLGAAASALDVSLRRTELPAPARRVSTPADRDAAPPDSLVRAVVASAPFRASRAAAPIAYDPERGLQPAMLVAPPPPPKPLLSLVGIVWGAEPTAVIEGMPGADGPRVVRKGETVGALRVNQINPTTVVVAGFDTTWHLTLRTSWP